MGKEFILKGEKLHIDEERINYNEVRKNFINLSDKALMKFKTLYKENNNIEDVYENAC